MWASDEVWSTSKHLWISPVALSTSPAMHTSNTTNDSFCLINTFFLEWKLQTRLITHEGTTEGWQRSHTTVVHSPTQVDHRKKLWPALPDASNDSYWSWYKTQTHVYCTDCSTVHQQTDYSQARHYYLVVPRYSLSSYGRRAFAVAGRTVWNSLSDDLRDLMVSTDSFRRLLKTRLFSEY